MTLALPVTFAHRVRQLPLGVLLVASLAGCPYIGAGTHDDNVAVVDADNDGVAVDDDCDDNNDNVFPGNVEQCDLVDNNCDGAIDEGFPNLFLDWDGDGLGDEPTDSCNMTDTTSEVDGDCDDNDAGRYPGNTEVCDGLDNDCNNQIDEDLPQLYVDRDQDGFGTTPIDDCTVSIPSSTQDGDCDDNNSSRYPGNIEICDGLDNDCTTTTGDAGLATLIPRNGAPPRNLDTTSSAITVITGRTDNAEVRFCSGTFDMSFQFENNSEPLLMSGLGRVELKPVSNNQRVLHVENSVLELNNLEIMDGNRDDGGAGMLCLNSAVTLNEVRFRNNIAPNGSAISADDCLLLGSQVSFIDNVATLNDAAIVQVALDSSIDWSSSVWSGNSGDRSLTLWDSTATLTAPLFSDSTDVGIFLFGESAVTVSDGDFSNNAGLDVMFSDGTGSNIRGGTINCASPGNTCTAP